MYLTSSLEVFFFSFSTHFFYLQSRNCACSCVDYQRRRARTQPEHFYLTPPAAVAAANQHRHSTREAVVAQPLTTSKQNPKPALPVSPDAPQGATRGMALWITALKHNNAITVADGPSKGPTLKYCRTHKIVEPYKHKVALHAGSASKKPTKDRREARE